MKLLLMIFMRNFSLSPKLIPHSWIEDDFDGSWTTQYNRKICWFLWYYYNLDWKNGESTDHFVRTYNVLYPQGIGFKLNMLPINFKIEHRLNGMNNLLR